MDDKKGEKRMNKSYVGRVKHKIFPLISDWSDSQDAVRFTYDVNKLSQKDWFWLHPSAYKLVIYDSPVLSIVFLLLASIILAFKGLTALSAIPLIISLFAGYDLAKKLKNKHLNKHTTMYDIYMREYKEEEIYEVN